MNNPQLTLDEMRAAIDAARQKKASAIGILPIWDAPANRPAAAAPAADDDERLIADARRMEGMLDGDYEREGAAQDVLRACADRLATLREELADATAELDVSDGLLRDAEARCAELERINKQNAEAIRRYVKGD